MLRLNVVPEVKMQEFDHHGRELDRIDAEKRREKMSLLIEAVKSAFTMRYKSQNGPGDIIGAFGMRMKLKAIFAVAFTILVLLSVNIYAKDIRVEAGDVQGLIDAISFANVSENPDVIVLEAGEYSFETMNNKIDGKNALPQINTKITMRAEGAILARDEQVNCHAQSQPDQNLFRFFHISQRGDLTLEGVVLAYGCAVGEAAASNNGGAVFVDGGQLKLVQSQIAQSYAKGYGGGIYVAGNGRVVIQRSVIGNNRAKLNGGGLHIWRGSANISTTQFIVNEAKNGGGIFNEGDLTLTASTLHRNEADDEGGAIFNGDEASAEIVNTTISKNEAEAGGGIYNDDDAHTKLFYTTIYANKSQGGGGIYNGALVEVAFSIVSQNSPDNCFNEAVWDSINPNLDDDLSCEAFSLNGDPRLGDLGGEGSTGYHAIEEGSPAIDAVPFEICRFDQDQRFSERPKGRGCDLGSYESDYVIEIPEQDPEPQPVPPTPEPPSTDPPAPEPTPGTDLDSYDTNGDCVINDAEFFDIIDAWLSQAIGDAFFFDGVDAWIGQESVCVVASSSRMIDAVELKLQSRGSRGFVFSMSTASASELGVEIFGLNGQSLFENESGNGTLFWNLQARSGKQVANGVYIAKLTLRDQSGAVVGTELKRITVLR